MTDFHFNVYLETCGVVLKDGTPAVSLVFIDKETGITDIYPIPLERAEEISQDLLSLVNSMNEKCPD